MLLGMLESCLLKRRKEQKRVTLVKVVTIGLDLAKHIFQVHGADAEGRFYEDGYSGARWLVSSPMCRRVWSQWKPAAARTIGAV